MCYSDILIYPERDGVYNNWGPTDNWAGRSLMACRFTLSPHLCFQTALIQRKTEWADSLFCVFLYVLIPGETKIIHMTEAAAAISFELVRTVEIQFLVGLRLTFKGLEGWSLKLYIAGEKKNADWTSISVGLTEVGHLINSGFKRAV